MEDADKLINWDGFCCSVFLISVFSDLKGATDFIHADALKVHREIKNERICRKNMSNLVFWNQKQS